MSAEGNKTIYRSTLTEMLWEAVPFYPGLGNKSVDDHDATVDKVKDTFREWLRLVGLTDYYAPNRDGVEFNTTKSICKLLITLVDEP